MSFHLQHYIVFFFGGGGCFDKTSYICFESLCTILLCIFSNLQTSPWQYWTTHTFSTLRVLILPWNHPLLTQRLWYLKFTSVTADTMRLSFTPCHRSVSSQCFPASFQHFSVRGKKKTLWTLMHPSLIVTY